MSDLIGKRIDQYEIVEEIGRGGMATVYKAHQASVNRDVAIKILPNQFARDPLFLKRFRQEARAIASLEHLHILPLHDFGTKNGYTYMVMRYVGGGTLADLMGQELPPERVVQLIGDIAKALDYAHRKGIVHRDIKPSNILIDDQGEPWLTDFGIAKMLRRSAEGTPLTATGHIMGTPEYVAPEQAEDQPIDGRSDIYSLGVVLYELLTGRPPYQANTPLAVVMLHVKEEPPPLPRTIKPDIPPPLERVVMKAMAKDPNRRYQTAAEMAQALQAALKKGEDQLATAASTPMDQKIGAASSPKSPAKAASAASARHRVIMPVILLLLLVAGGAAFILLGGRPESESPTPQLAAIVNESPTATPTQALPTATPVPTHTALPTVRATVPRQETATAAPTAEPTLSPTATPALAAAQTIPHSTLVGTIAYPVFNGKEYDIFFGQADGSGSRFFEASASQPAFSPDGTRIAFHSWRADARGLVTMDISGENGRLVSNFPEDQLPTWSADGGAIIFLSRRSGERKSELIRVSSVEEVGGSTFVGEGEYPTVGPNGQLVFKGWGLTGSGLRLAPLTFNDIQPVTDFNQDTAPAISPDGQRIAFMSQRDGNWEIYTVDVDGSNLQRLTQEPAEDGLPAWSPDGRAVAFVSHRGGAWAVWAMTPDGDDQRQLFEMEGSPDGFVGADPDASRGWTEERISWTR